ncbi:MAG: hypothetical protein J0L92_32250 [Deltaproteobacteria bacterium]|nr:hypothetical protein [Deltaproteobacteria bacterium]
MRGIAVVLSVGLVALATFAADEARAVRAVRPQIVRLVLDDSSVSPATSPDFDPAIVFRMLHARRPAFVGCYEREARLNDAIGEGTIALAVTLHPDSSTTATLDSDELSQPNIASCTTRVVNGFRFVPGPARDARFVVRLRYERPRSNEQ